MECNNSDYFCESVVIFKTGEVKLGKGTFSDSIDIFEGLVNNVVNQLPFCDLTYIDFLTYMALCGRIHLFWNLIEFFQFNRNIISFK